jgi:hypothetical protein
MKTETLRGNHRIYYYEYPAGNRAYGGALTEALKS